jgi:hypothetical protein
VLRCEFHRTDVDLSCAVVDPAEVELDAVDVGAFGTSADLRSYLSGRFCQVIDTLGWPLYVMGAVVRPDGPTTVYLTFDHIVVDGMSMPHVLHDLQVAYAAAVAGVPAELPPTGGYVAFANDQRARYTRIAADDDRLAYWRSFTERSGAFFPPFSLDLGIEPGRLYPTANRAESLLSRAEVDAFERRCHDAGGSLFAGVLAAVAVTLRKEGGPGTYRGLMPVSERGRGDWENAVGWFVNTLPIEFAAEPDMSLAELVSGVRSGFKELTAHADVPFVRAWELLEPVSFATHAWPYPVNFFSYIDTTRFPGAGHHPRWKPGLHVWTSGSRGTNSWFLRDAAGLHVNHLYSDTPRSRDVMVSVERTLKDTLREMVRAPAATGAGSGWPRPGR